MAQVNNATTYLVTLARGSQLNPEDWFGPFYISGILDHLSLGILCSQVWTYYTSFPEDPGWMKRLVAVTFCLSILKAFQSLYLVWEKSILGFGDWEDAFKLNWAFCISPFIATSLLVTAQVFFVWRCYTLTGRNRYFLIALIALMLVSLTLSAGLAVQLVSKSFDKHIIGTWVLLMFVAAIVFDSVITFTLSYKLAKSQNGDNQNTDSVITKLLFVTWQSALPPTLTQLAAVGVQFTEDPRLPTWNYLMGELTSRLYVFSLMYSLNSRLEIRKISRATSSADFPERLSAIEISEIRFRTPDRDPSVVDLRNKKGSFDQGVEEPPSALNLREVPSIRSATTEPCATGAVDHHPVYVPADVLSLNDQFHLPK